MIDQDAIDEVFPFNPLKQVAFEIRYPFNLQVQRDLCVVQKKLKDTYPKFQKDEIELIEGSLAKLYTFWNVEGTRSIRIGEDRLIILFTKYETFELFQAEALQLTKEVCNLFEITHCQRVGLRYVNNIEVPREGLTYKITNFINPFFDIKRATQTGPMKFSLEVTMKKPGCLITLRTAFSGKPPDQPGAVYLLDLDAYVLSDCPLEDLRKTSAELHHQIQLEFLSHITAEYKKVMRGQS
ncbi:hypothetical protein W02_24730 [Nitrospira sp. KM1]|uniref:TIGR04255 family protein n=1 Tax=Nitrospira sp. KM1 TaxID=1936990 RepID=UPI0013A727B7|nr:TIGR04255 family protein [Nitrospira sp. KM1]BCA55333.1 hypothetical protein W02_24730 [Nitrospira sp. KM1]